MASLHAIAGGGDPRETLLIEHDRMVTLVMAAIDPALHAQQFDKPLNIPALKKATARQPRQSIDARNAALNELGLTAEAAARALRRLGDKGSLAYADAVWPE